MEPFEQRAIDVEIVIGEGQYGEKKAAPVMLTGYRVIASTQVYNTQNQGTMQCVIYGVPLNLINQLTRIGLLMQNVKSSSVTLYAGDKGGAMSLAYQGNILESFGDFASMPAVPLVVTARGMIVDSVKPVAPSSFRGVVDAATVAKSVATAMKLSFKNDGVSAILRDVYLPGTGMDQLRSIARAAGFSFLIQNGTLTIWPKGKPRGGDPILISPATGLVGYPGFSSMGLVLTTIFNPNIQPGMKLSVQSSITPACGSWVVYSVGHQISSETPNGPWFTQIGAQRMEQ